MIQRGELACQVVGLMKVGVGGRYQANVLGLHGDRGQQGEALELIALPRAPLPFDALARATDEVRQEEGVELLRFGQLREPGPELQVRPARGALVTAVAPGS